MLEAHNGYLQIYLDLGLIGLFLICTFLIATYRKICKRLKPLSSPRFIKLGTLDTPALLQRYRGLFRTGTPMGDPYGGKPNSPRAAPLSETLRGRLMGEEGIMKSTICVVEDRRKLGTVP